MRDMQLRFAARFWTVIFVFLSNAVAFAQPEKPKTKDGQVPKKDNKEAGVLVAKWLLESFEGQPTTEAVEMLAAIAKGSKMGPGEGWFHPGQSRHGWKWLAEKHGVPPSGGIAKDKFLGPVALFDRLDRNKDGLLRADDFDPTKRPAPSKQDWMLISLFRQMNQSGDGKLTREEWLKFFDAAADGQDHLTIDSLRKALMPRPGKGGFADAPTPQMLVRGLFRGEIGSMHEGPKLNERAPDFSLRSFDGSKTIRLSDHFGKKPIVLMFGNFTCGPFRGTYPKVDELARRYQKDALFLGVYVREAHPTDGWRMGSNEKAGVSIAQPRNLDERVAVASTCSLKLKMSIPLLVDEMDDRVGHAYSGMPARLYVIDRNGKIAYKSGRGPFGFQPEEMEQELIMLLLEQSQKGIAEKKLP